MRETKKKVLSSGGDPFCKTRYLEDKEAYKKIILK